MESKKRNIIIFVIFTAILCIIQAGDVLITLYIYYTYPVFNESNPLYLLLKNIYLVILVKIVLVTLYLTLIFKSYRKIKSPSIRFLNIVLLVLFFLISVVVFLSNVSYLINTVPAEVEPIPETQKRDFYQQQILHLQIAEPKTTVIPRILFWIFYPMLIYGLFRLFENVLIFGS